MSTLTGGTLNLIKPELTDDHKVTIGTDLPANFQKVDDEFSAHLAEEATQSTLGHVKLPENWIAPTLLNGWVNFGDGWSTAAYYKDYFGIVRLTGRIKWGTTTGGTIIFVLPVGYRPSGRLGFTINAGDLRADVTIGSAGEVSIWNVTNNIFLYLDGISFRAV